FCTPISEDPSSQTAAEVCLRSTKAAFLDTHFQKEAVIVVDEKIYRNCVRVKQTNSFDFQYIAIYAGDFHVMKNYMIVVWDVLNES
ncbi:unnamed protein product, partial [Didymodactylos carnosus]